MCFPAVKKIVFKICPDLTQLQLITKWFHFFGHGVYRNMKATNLKLFLLDKKRTIFIMNTTTIPDHQCSAIFTLLRVDTVDTGHYITDARY